MLRLVRDRSALCLKVIRIWFIFIIIVQFHEVRRVADNNIYVIKNIRIKELASREQYEAINEVQILSKMESPYVVQYFDSFIANNNLNIVMEYCNKGDLQKMIKKAQSKNLRSLGEASTWNIILQVFMINIIFAFIILMQINACTCVRVDIIGIAIFTQDESIT